MTYMTESELIKKVKSEVKRIYKKDNWIQLIELPQRRPLDYFLVGIVPRSERTKFHKGDVVGPAKEAREEINNYLQHNSEFSKVYIILTKRDVEETVYLVQEISNRELSHILEKAEELEEYLANFNVPTPTGFNKVWGQKILKLYR